MTDIAQLGYSVDSSELTQATTELDKNAAAAARVQSASDKVARQAEKSAKAVETEARALEASTGRRDRLTALLNTERGQRVLEAEGMRKHAAALGRTAAGYNAAGVSAKQLLMAQRQLPMQFTDIAVSLQAGMSPMQVMLQQGTQIKDMFGGLGPALRASAGYIMGLVNPATLAAAAIAGLAIAYSQLEERQNAIDRSLIRTGRYTADYAEQLGDLSREMDEIAGVTAGSAARAIAEVASVGSFTDEQLRIAARAAETWRAATGDAVESTVESFEKIAKDPVKALLALNREYNFLTERQLEQISTLAEQGKEQEAVTAGFQAFAGAIESRAPMMAREVSSIGAAFRGLRIAASEAWDGVVQSTDEGFARMVETGSKYAPLLQRAAFMSIRLLQQQGGGGGGDFSRVVSGPSSPIVDSDQVERDRKAAEAWSRLELSNLSKQEKLEREIADIRKTGAASKKSELEIEKAISDARARYAESLPKARKQREVSDPANSIIQQLERQIALNHEQAASEETLTATERLLVQVRTDMQRIGEKASAASRDRVASLLAEAEASGKLAHAEEVRRRDMAANAALSEQLAQAERLRAQQAQTDLMGIGRGGEAAELLRRQLAIQRQYLDEVEKLNRQQRNSNSAISQQEYDLELQMLAQSRDRMLDIERDYQQQRTELQGDWKNGFTRAMEDYVASASDAAAMSADAFSNAFGGFEDAIARAVETGKLSFSSLAKSIIADLARISSRMATSAILQSVFGAFTGGASYNGMGQGTSFDVSGYASLGGGRAYGGNVRNDRYYQVGERNQPEIYHAGGKQYLIPGDSGRVDPIRAAPAAAGADRAMGTPQINIHLHGAPEGATATARQNESGGFDVEVMFRQIEGRMAKSLAGDGALAKAGQQAYGWRRQGVTSG